MKGAYRVAQVRAGEDRLMAQLPDGVLMARAATCLAQVCRVWLEDTCGAVAGARVVVLAGSGNNGGDAIYAGAWLARRGAAVTVVMLADQVHAGAAEALRRSGGRTISALGDESGAEAAVARADLVVDGIVGIGGSGALRGPAVALSRAARGGVIAVDIPSGVDPNTGAVADPDACVSAEVTVTFGVLKPGLLLPPGRAHAGIVQLVDIGLEPVMAETPEFEVMDLATAGGYVPQPGATDDKYTRGVVGVVAGSSMYPGAGILCTGSARFGGAGMVRYAGAAVEPVVTRWPEVVPAYDGPVAAGKVQAWVVGPGAGTDDAAHQRLKEALASDVPVLVDADAITLVAHDQQLQLLVSQRAAPTLFTPHEGEFARLGGDLSNAAGRVAAVGALAKRLDATVLLKGATTVVVSPDGGAVVSTSGPPDLATAGSGDVLSGLAGSMLSAYRGDRADPHWVARTAAAAAYLHGVAGRLAAEGGRPVVSEDVLAAVPDAIARARRAASS